MSVHKIASRTLPPNLKDYIFVLSIWPYRKKVVNESTSISRHCVNYITASQCIKKKAYSKVSRFRKPFPTEAIWLGHQANLGKPSNDRMLDLQSCTNSALKPR